MPQTDVTIPQTLTADCQAFVDAVEGLSEDQFMKHIDGKWSVADVMQHLYLSARPIVRLMTGPREVFAQWGEPALPARTYDQIEAAYSQGVKNVKAPATVSPRPEDMGVSQQEMIARFSGVYQALIEAVTTWPDNELDQYVIPHPALGKLSVREMLYFVSVHTRHHLKLLPVD